MSSKIVEALEIGLSYATMFRNAKGTLQDYAGWGFTDKNVVKLESALAEARTIDYGSITEQANAWSAVFSTLSEVAPGWHEGTDPSVVSACAKIRSLAEARAASTGEWVTVPLEAVRKVEAASTAPARAADILIEEALELFAASPPAPTVSAEPVAWRSRHPHVNWGKWGLSSVGPSATTVRLGWEYEPLYTAPPPVSVGAEPVVWSEADIANMRVAFSKRFNEPIPRTETLMGVAAVGYRKALGLDPVLNLSAPPPVEASQQQQQCPCGDRPTSQCPGEWEPGCDLGANEAFARRVAEPASGDIAELATWLRDNSSGIYRRCATAADLIEHQRAELSRITAELSDVSGRSAEIATKAADEIDRLTAERDALKAEIENLQSVMIAAAEEIHAHWQAHCDSEGYGPANLMRRLEKGIPAEYAYKAGDFARLGAERSAAKAEAEALREVCQNLVDVADSSPPLQLFQRIAIAVIKAREVLAAQQGEKP